MNDLDLCCLCATSYDIAAPWDVLIQPGADNGVWVALRRLGDVDVLVYRGSITLQDWARDIFFAPHPVVAHPRLGQIHAGFYLGLEDALAKLRPMLRERVIVTGHSLGAARAVLTAALLADGGLIPEAVTVFGEPRSGYQQLTDFMAPVPIHSYCNGAAGGHDLVTDVPFTTLPFPFARVRPLIKVSAPPLPHDDWGALRFHHIQLYEAGVAQALSGAAA